jgi:hypothetical protein
LAETKPDFLNQLKNKLETWLDDVEAAMPKHGGT